jgi:hypothetical protein
MRTLIYKRTHSGDPDPETGIFGNHDCEGEVRDWAFAQTAKAPCEGEAIRLGCLAANDLLRRG